MGKFKTTVLIIYYSIMFPSQCEGKELSWRHLISLYYRNNGCGQLSLVPKLKYEHVYLNSFSKMRVDLAAQVSKIFAWSSVP